MATVKDEIKNAKKRTKNLIKKTASKIFENNLGPVSRNRQSTGEEFRDANNRIKKQSRTSKQILKEALKQGIKRIKMRNKK